MFLACQMRLYTLIWWCIFLAIDVYLSVVILFFGVSIYLWCPLGTLVATSQDDWAECNQVHNILIEASWNHQLKLGLVHKQFTQLHCMWNPQVPAVSDLRTRMWLRNTVLFSLFFERKLPEFLCLVYWPSWDPVLLQLSCRLVVRGLHLMPMDSDGDSARCNQTYSLVAEFVNAICWFMLIKSVMSN